MPRLLPALLSTLLIANVAVSGETVAPADNGVAVTRASGYPHAGVPTLSSLKESGRNEARSPTISAAPECDFGCFSMTWERRAPVISVMQAGEGVEGPADGIVGDKIYVSHGHSFGDVSSLRVYDIPTDTWTIGPQAPASGARSEGQGVAVGDKHYSIGGRDAFAFGCLVDIYDTTTATWSAGTDMPTCRRGAGIGAIGNVIHVVGPDPSSVLVAFCESSPSLLGLSPVEITSTVPTFRSARLGLFRDASSLESLFAIRMRLDGRSGRWTTGNGDRPVAVVKAPELPDDALRIPVSEY